MNFSFVVKMPAAQATRIVSGSYRLNESSTDSIPALSAAWANLSQPGRSGRAAGECALVVSTREVSWAVFIPTSPPFGNIQWNLRLILSSASLVPPRAQVVQLRVQRLRLHPVRASLT